MANKSWENRRSVKKRRLVLGCQLIQSNRPHRLHHLKELRGKSTGKMIRFTCAPQMWSGQLWRWAVALRSRRWMITWSWWRLLDSSWERCWEQLILSRLTSRHKLTSKNIWYFRFLRGWQWLFFHCEQGSGNGPQSIIKRHERSRGIDAPGHSILWYDAGCWMPEVSEILQWILHFSMSILSTETCSRQHTSSQWTPKTSSMCATRFACDILM